MMKRFVISLLFLLCIVTAAQGVQAAESFTDQYDAAAKAYYDHDYPKALAGFGELLVDYPNDGLLYYNLGNVYYQQGDYGSARQFYEKACLQLPRFGDLQLNLKQVMQKLVDAPQKSFSDYLLGTFYFWLKWLTLSETGIVLIIVSVLFWIFCFQRFLHKRSLFVVPIVLFFVFYAYLSLGYFFKFAEDQPGHNGIILPTETEVRASFLEKEKPLFILHQGTKVRILDSQKFDDDSGWLSISLPTGQKGWVKADEVGVI